MLNVVLYHHHILSAFPSKLLLSFIHECMKNDYYDKYGKEMEAKKASRMLELLLDAWHARTPSLE
jgi:hypothetical protein